MIKLKERATLQSGFEQGGLNAPNPILLNLTMKLKTYFRMSFTNIDHPIKNIWQTKFNEYGIDFQSNISSLDEKEYYKQISIKNPNSNFILDCFKSFKFYNHMWREHLKSADDSALLHTQYKALYANSLIKTMTSDRTQGLVNRLENRHGIFRLIHLFKNNTANIFLERSSITNQIPKQIKNALTNHTQKYDLASVNIDKTLLCVGYNKWKNFKLVKTADLRGLCAGHFEGPAQNPFILLRKSTKCSILRDFQFKLLHKILSTRSKLFKYKYIANDSCLSCLEEGVTIKDDIPHTVYQCPRSKSTWENFKIVCNSKLNSDVELSEINCINGFFKTHKIVNELAIKVKKLLHAPVNPRNVVSVSHVEAILDILLRLDKYRTLKISNLVNARLHV